MDINIFLIYKSRRRQELVALWETDIAHLFAPRLMRLGDADVFIGVLSVVDGGSLSDFQRGNVASN